MEAAPRRLLGACAVVVLMAITVANAGSGEAASVIGLAKCADCTRKNMNAEAAFNGLKVAIKCKNSKGEYESKAVGELQSSGAFSVPISVNLADCVAQLHNAAGTPCPGQEPSRITPLSDGTFVAVPGNTQQASSAVCASVTICGPVMKYFHDHFHKKEEKPDEPSKPEPEPNPQPDPQPKPQPENQPPTPTYGSATPTNGSPTPGSGSDHAPHTFDHFYKDHHHHFFNYFHKKPVPPEPKPEPKPQPENQPPTPTYGSATPPIYHPPAMLMHLTNQFHKDHELEHFFDHFHKKPVVSPKPEPQPKPQPENQPPTPTYRSATRTNGSPTPGSGSDHAPHTFDHFYKGHHHHFFGYFHKKLEPKPEPKPQPENQPPTPTYGTATPPIYHPPAMHMHLTDQFHKDHELDHFFDHFHKKPVVSPKPEPQPKPQPENQPPTPTYGSATPTNRSPTPGSGSDHAPHTFDHFYKGHHHHFFDYFHKKPVPSEPKPEPKPQPENQPPTPTYGSATPPIYHPPAMHMHLTDQFHKDHELDHFFDHFHKKPVVPPKPEPQPKPQPENQPPTPTYGSVTPTNGSPTPRSGSNHVPHTFDHFYKGHNHHFFDYFHKKPVPPEPKPKPEPEPQPENKPPMPTFGSPPPLYHPPAKH